MAPSLLAVTLLIAISPAPAPAATARPSALSAADTLSLHHALDAYDQGRLDEAQTTLDTLLQKHPANYQVLETLGSLHAQKADYTGALPFFEKASRIAPKEAVAHANLGASYLELARPADAVQELQKASILDPGNADTLSNLGQAFMAASQPKEASTAFAAASSARPEDANLRYNLAVAYFSAGLLPNAASTLSTIPTSAYNEQTHSLAGDLAERQGHFKEAVDHYQAAATLNPSDANLYALTIEFLRHWTWEEARRVANYSAERYPASPHFQVASGIASYGKGEYAAAATTLSPLLIADPNNSFYADLLGRSCSLLGESSVSACTGLQAFAETHPENAQASVYAATALLNRPAGEQDPAVAARLLNQAIAADPRSAEAYYELGVLDQQRSLWQESATALEKATVLRPAYAEAHYRLARAYSHTGNREAAQKEIGLQQQYSQAEKDHLNAKLKEITTFLVDSNAKNTSAP